MVSLLNAVGEFTDGFRDPLGEIYTTLISEERNGHFFTPEHISDKMMQRIIGDNEHQQKIFEPACWSGRMVLAAANLTIAPALRATLERFDVLGLEFGLLSIETLRKQKSPPSLGSSANLVCSPGVGLG